MGKSRISAEAQVDAINKLTELYRSGQFESAIKAARAACKTRPDHPAAWNIRGAAARALGKSNEAELSFSRLEALQPALASAPYNLALVYEDTGRSEDAVAAYNRALGCDPNLAQAHNNLGILLGRVGETKRALEHVTKAAALQPGIPEVQNSLGNVLKSAGYGHEAKDAYQKALALKPDFASALYNLGVLEEDGGDALAAVAAYSKALKIEPGHAAARTALLHQYSQICDWEAMEPLLETLPELGVTTAPVPPFPLLMLEDNLERQSIRARRWSEARYGHVPPLPPIARPSTRPRRLKLGYYSACYRDHPFVQLLSGILRSHDRERFEVHAISCGPNNHDAGRRKSEALVDYFHDVEGESDLAIAKKVRELGIDILIDHDGHTLHNRSAPVAMRPSPVQINMMGFPGSIGADFHDYIVCDNIVVPDRAHTHYSEKLLQLPNSYQCNDNTNPISDKIGTRADHGLPDDAFVFACFNVNSKITPREFAIWMRVLGTISGSILWLRGTSPLAAGNLRREAKAHGIDPARLIFAGFVPQPDHLARHTHADLAIDTFACGAHTTGSDALWSGLPMVTKLGAQFAARVGASLLEAVGFGELVTHSDKEYEALLIALAQDPARLAKLKGRIAGDRSKLPLFDTTAYTRHLEAGFDAAYARWLKGEAPADISVPA